MDSSQPTGTWVKRTSSGAQFHITLQSSGSLIEWSPEAPDETWSGEWRMLGPGRIEVTIGPYRSTLTRHPNGAWNGLEMTHDGPNGEVTLDPMLDEHVISQAGTTADDLKAFVRAVLDGKDALNGVDVATRERLVDDLATRLESRILRSLIDALDETQFADFEQVVEHGDLARLASYFTDAGIPVQQITMAELDRFAQDYA